MNEKAIYRDRKKYIEETLNAVIAPSKDYKRIDYVVQGITSQEYIRVSDRYGNCLFLDVTARSLEDILKDLSKLILNPDFMNEFPIPTSLVTGKEERYEAAELFDCQWR